MFKKIGMYFAGITSAKWFKGLELAIMGSVGTAIYTSLAAGSLPMTIVAFKPIILGGMAAGVSYLLHPVAGEVAPAPDPVLIHGKPEVMAPDIQATK